LKFLTFGNLKRFKAGKQQKSVSYFICWLSQQIVAMLILHLPLGEKLSSPLDSSMFSSVTDEREERGENKRNKKVNWKETVQQQQQQR